MYIDLTTTVPQNSPQMQWAKAQEIPYIAMGHIGTHLDTYEKSSIPLEYFKSEGVVFDVRGKAEIKPEDISLELVKEKNFVCFRTGRIEEYAYGEDGYFKEHPELSNDLIQALLDRKIRFIGIDCPGIKQNAEHEKADRLCEKYGVYVIENLKNLAEISAQRFGVYTMWLEDERMTGLKCRVIAEI